MPHYYETAEDGEIIGMVPIDVEPLESPRRYFGRGSPNQEIYATDLMQPESGMRLFAIITVVTFLAMALSPWIIPIAIVLFLINRKAQKDD